MSRTYKREPVQESEQRKKKEKEFLKEINRRVAAVKQLLYGRVLGSGIGSLAISQVLGYLHLLVQEPLLVFLYERNDHKDKKTYALREYFDLEKVLRANVRDYELIGCENLTAVDTDKTSKTKPEINLTEEQREEKLFQILDTRFYIRIFLLVSQETDYNEEASKARFQEISCKSQPQKDTNTVRYVRECAHRLYGGENGLSLKTGKVVESDFIDPEFFTAYKKELTDIMGKQSANLERGPELIQADKIQVGDRERALTALRQKIEEERKWFSDNLTGDRKGLDRIYRRFSRPTRLIKRMSPTYPRDKAFEHLSAGNLPNIFFVFRSFDREYTRCTQSGFEGYTHNTRFVIPAHQREDLLKFLATLNDGKLTLTERFSNIKQERDIEAAWDKKEALGKSKPKVSYFAKLRNELDAKFWEMCKSEDGRVELVDMFGTTFGDNSLSFAESAFHSGSLMIRYPFRRRAGLTRVLAIERAYQSYVSNGGNPREFGLEQIDDEAENDALRVVLAYYVLGAMAPTISNRENHRTKLILFPIEVGGSVMGAVGHVVFEPRKDRKKPPPTETEASRRWSAALHFFQDVYVPLIRDVRQLIRDLQLAALTETIESGVQRLYSNAIRDENGELSVTQQAMNEFVTELNRRGRLAARFNPYRPYDFSWEQREEVESGAEIKDRGMFQITQTIAVYFSISPTAEIFTRNLKGFTAGTDSESDRISNIRFAEMQFGYRANHILSTLMESERFRQNNPVLH
jgi:hypothetical protein